MAYGNGRRWRQNGRRGEGQHKRSPADHAAVKACYAVLQAIHHLCLVKTDLNGELKMFRGKRIELNKFFKTAGEKNDQLYIANKEAINAQWQVAQLVELQEHFERMRDSNVADLKSKKLEKTKLSEIFNLGVDWAKNSFGRKFTKRDFEEGRDLIFKQSKEAAKTPAASAPKQNPARSSTSAGTRVNPQIFAETKAKKAFAEAAMKQTEQAPKTPAAPTPQQNPARASTSAGTRENPQIFAEINAKKAYAEAVKKQAANDPAAPPPTGTDTRPPSVPRPHIPEVTEDMEVETPSKKRAASPEGTPDSEDRPSKPGKKLNFTQRTPPPPPNFDKTPPLKKPASKIPVPASKLPRSPEHPPPVRDRPQASSLATMAHVSVFLSRNPPRSSPPS